MNEITLESMSNKLNTFFLALTLGGFMLGGCQEEITEIIDPPQQDAFTASSTLANLINRTSLNDGSDDNIVDGSSCTELVLPVKVLVNDLEITLDSKEDFKTVEKMLDQFDDDDDLVEIFFPVTVILADHSTMQINNEEDYEDLVDQCVEDGADDDIECVDFKYPITVSLYDPVNERSEVVTIENDKEMYVFIDEMDKDDIVGFVFPVTVILADDTEITISNFDVLEDVLEDAIDACDEDDDNDHNDDDVDDTQFREVLVNGEWIITNFLDDNDDETATYVGYVFTFNESGEVKAQKGTEVATGTWEIDGDDGSLTLDLDFNDSLLDELDEDWDVLQYSGSKIDLGDDDSGRLVFEKK